MNELGFVWQWGENTYSVDKDLFSPITCTLRRLVTSFTALPALKSICSPCLQHLQFINPVSTNDVPFVLQRTTFKVLQKWHSSLTSFVLTLGVVDRIEDDTFIWTPNLVLLYLAKNQLKYLSKNTFNGLTVLQKLHLADNILTEVPSEAFMVFRNITSLYYLDLSNNRIVIGDIAQDAFSSVSSLTHLNLGGNIMENVTPFHWMIFFRKLNGYMSLVLILKGELRLDQ